MTSLRRFVTCFGKQRNVTVAMAEVTGVDVANRRVLVDYLGRPDTPFEYDYLILATGASHSYFGHNEFAPFAPGMKTLADAESVRAKALKAFETAEMEDPSKHRDLLTFVLVGAGPTGVEMAGALAELRRFTLKSDFRRIDPLQARIILAEAGPRILSNFPEELSRKARARLESVGVEVRLGQPVKAIDEAYVVIGDETIPCRTVIWTAGVTPSPAGKWLNAPTDKAGRVRTQPDCSVPGHPEVFVVGDTASLDQDGKPLPGVAQVAMQGGRYVGKVIDNRASGRPAPPPFRYFDKGNMAVVGRGFRHCGFTIRENERATGMARVGLYSHSVSPGPRQSVTSLDAGDVVVLHSPTEFGAYRRAARADARSEKSAPSRANEIAGRQTRARAVSTDGRVLRWAAIGLSPAPVYRLNQRGSVRFAQAGIMLSDWERCRELVKTLAKAVLSFVPIAFSLLALIVVRAQSPPEQLRPASEKRNGADVGMGKEPVANTIGTLDSTDSPKGKGEATDKGETDSWGPVPTGKTSLANLAPALLPYFNNGPVFGLPGTVTGNFWDRTQLSGDWAEFAQISLVMDCSSISTRLAPIKMWHLAGSKPAAASYKIRNSRSI